MLKCRSLITYFLFFVTQMLKIRENISVTDTVFILFVYFRQLKTETFRVHACFVLSRDPRSFTQFLFWFHEKNVWFDEIFHVFTKKCCDLTNFLTRNVWLLAHKIGMAIFLWRFVEFCINSLMIAVLGLGFGKLKHDDEELSLTLGIISWNLDISRQLADVSSQE